MASENDILNPENDIVSVSVGETTFTDFTVENKIDHGFWINDLYFEVPPERISSQEENSYAEYQGMRSNNSFKIPTGIASEIFSISFTIPHKSAIVNIDERNLLDSDQSNTGKRGGVFDLLLQFKHIPFACIENAYLRSKLKVPSTHNMVFCMHNLALSTSPGEPNVLVGALTISPVSYTPYSDRWLFKQTWQTKDGLNFDSVNKIDLPGRIAYAPGETPEILQNGDLPDAGLLMSDPTPSTTSFSGSPSLMEYPPNGGGKTNQSSNFLSPPSTFLDPDRNIGPSKEYTIENNWVNPKIIKGTAAPSFQNALVNPMYQTPESINYMDMQMMAPFAVTQYAKESQPFKAYIDWIYYQYTNKVANNALENNTYDFTKFQPYGAANHDLGNTITFKWKEFKNIPIDPEVADKLRLFIKRRIASHRSDLFRGNINNLDTYGTAAGEINTIGQPADTGMVSSGATGPTTPAQTLESQMPSSELSSNGSESIASGGETQTYISIEPGNNMSTDQSSLQTQNFSSTEELSENSEITNNSPAPATAPATTTPAATLPGGTATALPANSPFDYSKPVGLLYPDSDRERRQLKYTVVPDLDNNLTKVDCIIIDPIDWEIEQLDPGHEGMGEQNHIEVTTRFFAPIAKARGWSNEKIAGLMTVAMKESGFAAKGEGGPGENTSWSKEKNKLPGYTEEEYYELRKSMPKYFDARYGRAYRGNSSHLKGQIASNKHVNEFDGYRYRGRGSIQITWKDNYRKRSKDIWGAANQELLVDHPWLLHNKRVNWHGTCAYIDKNIPTLIRNIQNKGLGSPTRWPESKARAYLERAGLDPNIYGNKNWTPTTTNEWFYMCLSIVGGASGVTLTGFSDRNYPEAKKWVDKFDIARNTKVAQIIVAAQAKDALAPPSAERVKGIGGPSTATVPSAPPGIFTAPSNIVPSEPSTSNSSTAILPGTTISGQTGDQKEIANLIREAVNSLPRGITQAEDGAIANYLTLLEKLKADGWHLYDQNLTTFDLFYKEHSMVVIGDGELYPSPHKKEPLVCDFMSGTAFNLFKKMPMQGLITPTAQFLGRQDNSFVLSFRGNGLNSIKKLEVIKDTLKKQGIIYKYIPEAYSLRLENNFINAFGDLYFVINGLESSTIPEAPGSYSLEMRLTANDIYVKHTKIHKEYAATNRLAVIESFLHEILRLEADDTSYSNTENSVQSQTRSNSPSASKKDNSPSPAPTPTAPAPGPDTAPLRTPGGVRKGQTLLIPTSANPAKLAREDGWIEGGLPYLGDSKDPLVVGGVNYGIIGMHPVFIDRLNSFYEEATSLGYTIRLQSAYRTKAHQRRTGSTAKPGFSYHQWGLAVDLQMYGNGVNIRSFNATDRKKPEKRPPYGDWSENKDTLEFRNLVKKHKLHQPLHVASDMRAPNVGNNLYEKWHIEPIETRDLTPRDSLPSRMRFLAKLDQEITSDVAAAAGSPSPAGFAPFTETPTSTTDNGSVIGKITEEMLQPQLIAVKIISASSSEIEYLMGDGSKLKITGGSLYSRISNPGIIRPSSFSESNGQIGIYEEVGAGKNSVFINEMFGYRALYNSIFSTNTFSEKSLAEYIENAATLNKTSEEKLLLVEQIAIDLGLPKTTILKDIVHAKRLTLIEKIAEANGSTEGTPSTTPSTEETIAEATPLYNAIKTQWLDKPHYISFTTLQEQPPESLVPVLPPNTVPAEPEGTSRPKTRRNARQKLFLEVVTKTEILQKAIDEANKNKEFKVGGEYGLFAVAGDVISTFREKQIEKLGPLAAIPPVGFASYIADNINDSPGFTVQERTGSLELVRTGADTTGILRDKYPKDDTQIVTYRIADTYPALSVSQSEFLSEFCGILNLCNKLIMPDDYLFAYPGYKTKFPKNKRILSLLKDSGVIFSALKKDEPYMYLRKFVHEDKRTLSYPPQGNQAFQNFLSQSPLGLNNIAPPMWDWRLENRHTEYDIGEDPLRMFAFSSMEGEENRPFAYAKNVWWGYGGYNKGEPFYPYIASHRSIIGIAENTWYLWSLRRFMNDNSFFTAEGGITGVFYFNYEKTFGRNIEWMKQLVPYELFYLDDRTADWNLKVVLATAGLVAAATVATGGIALAAAIIGSVGLMVKDAVTGRGLDNVLPWKYGVNWFYLKENAEEYELNKLRKEIEINNIIEQNNAIDDAQVALTHELNHRSPYGDYRFASKNLRNEITRRKQELEAKRQEVPKDTSIPVKGPEGDQIIKNMEFFLRPTTQLDSAFVVSDLRGLLDGLAFTLEDQAEALKNNDVFSKRYKNIADNLNNIFHRSMVLPDDNFMEYVWNYLIIPYINNSLQYERIVDIALGTDYFPKTRELIIQDQQSNIGPAYEDLMLPYHPYWNANGNNLSRGPSFTEPDFYLVNPGVDTKDEESSRKIDSKASKLTPSEAYNMYVTGNMEYAYADMQGLRSLMVEQNPEVKIKNGIEVPEEKKAKAIQNELMDTNVSPKTILKDPNVVPLEEQKYDPKSNLVEWKDVRLMFGDNLNLISPLNANIGEDGRLLNSRMLNYTYQDYDVISGEDAILKMKQGYEKEYLASTSTTSGDPVSNPTGSYPLFNFYDMEDDGSGDASPVINFSNTRYPMQLKLKEAIKGIGKRKMAGRRAYPNFKIFFIEEDDLYNKSFTEYDDFYSFSTIESLEISDSRKRPAAVCKVTFLDQHGILSGFNQWTKAADPQIIKKNGTDQDMDSEYALNTESRNPFLKGTRYEQSDVAFKLNPGIKIKICGGFSNDANKLEEIFLGEVTDVNMDGSGNRVEIVAMSYGAELAASIKGISEDETKVEFNDTFDLLAHLMFEPEVLHFGRKKFDSVEMFGEGQSLKSNQIQYKETFAAGAMINAARPGGFPNYFLFYKPLESAVSGLGTAARGVGGSIIYDGYERFMKSFSKAAKKLTQEPNEGPQDDNIFAPNFTPQQGYYWYDYFKRWTGSVTKDGDMRIVTTGSPEKMDGVDVAAATAAVTVPAAGVAGATIGGMFGSAWVALGTIGAASGAGIAATALGIITGVGIGILIGVAIGVLIAAAVGTVKAIIDGLGAIDPKEIDTAMLLQIHSPESLKYNIFYSTIWDIFEEMTLRHPGYVKHPRIYYNSNRMTMFFGLPDQNMWERAGDPLDIARANKLFKELADDTEKRYRHNNSVGPLTAGPQGRKDIQDYKLEEINANNNSTGSTSSRRLKEIVNSNNKAPILVDADRISKYMKYVIKRFKPFRKWHNINSYTDIISNDIDATADGWYTEIQIQYTSIPGLFSDTSALNASQSNKIDIRDPNSSVDWDSDKVVTKRATVDLAPNFVRSASYQFVNAKSIGMAKCYARALLAKQAKDMYKGSLTIMGNPSIRPYDVCMVCDTYNQIYGPIEVEEVHHIFSPETGYVTQVYPDTFIVQEDVTPYVLLNGLQHDVFVKNEYYMENALAAAPAWGDLNNMSSEGRKYFNDLQRVITEYRRASQENEQEISLAKDALLGNPFSNPITNGSLAQAGAGAAGLGAIAAGVAMGVGALPATLIGGLAFSLTYFYAASTLTNIVMNYIADSRAFMMIPLIKEGIPMVAGINIGYGSGMYKTPLQYIRQYWMDGGVGGNMTEADLLMQHSNIYVKNGGNLDSWLASAELGFQKFSLSWDNAFVDMRDTLTVAKLFKEGNDPAFQEQLQTRRLRGIIEKEKEAAAKQNTTVQGAQTPPVSTTP